MSTAGAEEKARGIYKDLLDYLKAVKNRVVFGKSFKLGKAVRCIENIIHEPVLMPAMTPLTMRIVQDIDYLISHQVNVMIYSLRLGSSLGYEKTALLDLGLASLLHDIGLFMIPGTIIQKSEPLTASELEAIKDHPRRGKILISPWEMEHPGLPAVVYQHHERGNGKGYPQGLKDHEMHDHAKIIGLVDAFEAMTQNRPHRKRLKQFFTFKELLSSAGGSAFSPLIAKAFMKEITPYPEGSFVMLNNRLLCVVVAIDRSNPIRPDVEVLYDQEGNEAPGRVIRLKESPLLFIVDRLTPDELAQP